MSMSMPLPRAPRLPNNTGVVPVSMAGPSDISGQKRLMPVRVPLGSPSDHGAGLFSVSRGSSMMGKGLAQ